MERGNTSRLLVTLAAALLLIFSNETQADARYQSHLTSGGTVGSQWTESDWMSWWENIEDLYLSGLEDEGMYWLLRHDLEVLGHFEELFSDIDIPDPYSGWNGGGTRPNDPSYPVIPHSNNSTTLERHGGYEPMYGQMPEEWGPLIRDHGLDPANFGGYHIPAPPMWLAASISLLGTNLTWSPHPGTQIVGRILVTAGGLMIIWIEIEEEKQEDSE